MSWVVEEPERLSQAFFVVSNDTKITRSNFGLFFRHTEYGAAYVISVVSADDFKKTHLPMLEKEEYCPKTTPYFNKVLFESRELAMESLAGKISDCGESKRNRGVEAEMSFDVGDFKDTVYHLDESIQGDVVNRVRKCLVISITRWLNYGPDDPNGVVWMNKLE
jgi:hypothetical protein